VAPLLRLAASDFHVCHKDGLRCGRDYTWNQISRGLLTCTTFEYPEALAALRPGAETSPVMSRSPKLCGKTLSPGLPYDDGHEVGLPEKPLSPSRRDSHEFGQLQPMPLVGNAGSIADFACIDMDTPSAAAIAEYRPERLTGNVLGRSILQESLLPRCALLRSNSLAEG